MTAAQAMAGQDCELLLTQRLRSKVNRDGPGGCWLWTAGVNRAGYGWFRFQRTGFLAHRLSFYLANGFMPEVVRHACDVPACVNPAHLLAGDHAANMQDAVDRGRTTRGERNFFAKLTRAQVVEIRDRYAAGGVTQYALALEFGIKQPTVSNIVAGRFWGWLDQ